VGALVALVAQVAFLAAFLAAVLSHLQVEDQAVVASIGRVMQRISLLNFLDPTCLVAAGGGGMSFDFGNMGDMEMGGFSSNAGRRGKKKGKTVEVPLKVSLKDLYNGVPKKIKITRNKMEGNRRVPEEKQIEIDIKKGWKAGTKITFEGYGDEEAGLEPGDIQFVIQEKKHPVFTRDGNDLTMKKKYFLIGCFVWN